ncbi:MAG: PAS domain-containing protein [Deltaproteobacteria bacterium]|nr:PAS domain-containing protein [Deltaproteobacteria bacterium]
MRSGLAVRLLVIAFAAVGAVLVATTLPSIRLSPTLVTLALAVAFAAAGFGLWAAWSTANALRELRDSVRAHSGRPGAGASAPAGELRDIGFAIGRLRGELATALDGLTSERDRLSAILDGMIEAVVVTGADGRIVLANDAFRGLIGEVVTLGREPLEVLRSADFGEALREAAAGATVEREIHLLSPTRTLVAHAAPLPRRPGTAGDEGGAICVLHDITELRRLETIRRDFVTNVSHELRTPVTALRGYAETLLDGALDDPRNARRFVEIIHRHAERLTRLIADLLTLARVEGRQLEVARNDVDLAPIAAATIRLVTPLTRDKKLTVTGDLAGSHVLGDADWIEQVVINLLDNAVKYTPAGGTIKLSAAPHAGRTRVEVWNSGPGIEAQHLDRLFERFYRVDAGRARGDGGTGLGLAISKHLIEAMGGEIGVASEAGKGVTFWFDLPGAPAPASADPPVNPTASES